ncbi:MAG TPA: hypothetical protein VLV83_03425 [Acidobacteriota bacterium]|nr:hypothetical protein [Acidobacteriota bacterium]
MERFLGLPEQASAHAGQIDYMMGLVHVLMVLLFVGWALYFLYVLYRFRSSRQPKADSTGVKSKASSYVEAGVALFEAVLLIGFSMPLWAERVNDFPSEEDAVVVRVVGEQFAWNIHYPGEDGVFGRTDIGLIDVESNPLGLDTDDPYAKDDVVSLNQLHLPVDQPVLIYLSSKDVIHSFNLPHHRVKQDAIPGLSIPVWFVPTVTNADMAQRLGQESFQFEIACAQLCGLGHYRMRGFLTVETQEEFEAWLKQRAEEAAAASSADDFWNQ